ncbi:MAG TPA: response regulator [Candidatus Acidoferrum sp.]|nr:response regulator [Candidatus Acidoferrum sp.]
MREQALLAGRRILVVEDEALIALMIRDLLAEMGATVIGPAGTVAEALALVASERLDGAILDYRLPDGTSRSVADALAARNVPFFFASGYDPNSIDRRYTQTPKLSKVFDRGELLEMVVSVLGRRPA